MSEHFDQPVDGKSAKIGIADSRYICRRNTGELSCLAYRKLAPVEGDYDFGGQLRLHLARGGICKSEIGENIVAAPNDFEVFIHHDSISFKRFKRASINSISF
jgi:hypothetical protein